ncbi:GNAT family N-acetyltransferase [Paenibacillus harenae]|uniref:GNAT family N-acetyltransferase n=1 Tax=Paenibacillus harenae TaxID=306543 RepID=UPI00278FD2AF|nr:GNAT family N-acetyltransferase [Paenibacillus harenae]MDQ0059897.1 ribosomal protein S18 acetylase RimI-like enzyme [Paenibacillus harenae]
MLQQIPARPEDDPFLFDLYAESRKDELQAWGWDEAMQRSFLQMQWNAQKQSYAMHFPGSEQSLLVVNEIRVGRAIVCRKDREIRLVDLTILSEFRNQGFGTMLLRQLQDGAASARLPLRLSVLKTNPAKALYVRLGFWLIGENDMYDFMESGEPTKG